MKYVIFDLDNCLSDDGWRIEKIDWTKTNPAERYAAYHFACSSDTARNVDVFNTYAQTHKVLFFTARPESVREDTRQWIEHELGVNCPSISMRGNNDHRPSVDLKRHMLQEFVAMGGAKEDIVGAFDDHEGVLQMYAEEGVDACRLAIHDRCAYTPPERKLRAPDLLAEGAETFRQRNAVYGDTYLEFGKACAALFPNGLRVEAGDVEGFNRLGVFVQCLSKVARYSANINTGGHPDSAHDLMVYAAMLQEVTK